MYFVAANGDYNQAAAQYDLAGNQISLEQGGKSGAVETEKYDAWDRLVEVDDASGHPIETFTYDGTGRRVTRLRPTAAAPCSRQPTTSTTANR